MSEDRSRRDFMWTAGAALGTAMTVGVSEAEAQDGPDESCAPPKSSKPAVQFKAPDTPVRVRRSAFELDADAVAKLKLAYSKLRDLTKSDPKDPRGWMQQAQVHCFNCSGGAVEIHNGWWFFPWHRAYLYFHERILAKLAGDPNLTLPYWDWNTVKRNRLPPPYITPNNTTNSLFDKNRSPTPTSIMPASTFSLTTFNQQMNVSTTKQFLGWPTDDPQFAGTGGSLEWGTHGTVHNWTGMHTNSAVDMGNLLTAARDPIFFSHHCNIDRLWDVWKTKASHKNYSQNEWLDHRWEFYDENSVLTSISIRDVIDHENGLRYRYQPPKPPPSPAALTAKLSISPESLEQLHAIAEPQGPPQVLHITGIQVPPQQNAVVQVLLNDSDAGTAAVAGAASSGSLVGTFSWIARGHAHKPMSVALPITQTIAAELAKGDAQIRLVPVAGTAKPENLSFEKADVVTVKD
jgi:polyphenol oxidase